MMHLSPYHVELVNEWISDEPQYVIVGKKTTVCLITLKNGFEIVGTSACVNPADFNKEIGEHYAYLDALNKLDGYAGFYRQCHESM